VTTAADAGTPDSCRVRAEDATDATSAALAIRRPTIVLAPTNSGEPRLNRTLSCTRGDWDDTAADRYAVTYTWLRAGVAIPGATSPAYTLGRDDVGRAMSCRVRAEDATDALSVAVTTLAPQALLRPMLSGQPHLRGELACTRGTWDDTPEQRYAVSYQWYRTGAPINGATNPTYVVGTADLGRSLSCSATAEVLSESFATAVTVANPFEAVLPRIEGIAHPRRELTCGRGEWNDSPGKRYVTTYKWRRNAIVIPDADGPDHIVVAQDVGTSLTCAVTAEGARTAISPAVTPTWEPLRLSLLPSSARPTATTTVAPASSSPTASHSCNSSSRRISRSPCRSPSPLPIRPTRSRRSGSPHRTSRSTRSPRAGAPPRRSPSGPSASSSCCG
jgi:hypothetical protein